MSFRQYIDPITGPRKVWSDWAATYVAGMELDTGSPQYAQNRESARMIRPQVSHTVSSGSSSPQCTQNWASHGFDAPHIPQPRSTVPLAAGDTEILVAPGEVLSRQGTNDVGSYRLCIFVQTGPDRQSTVAAARRRAGELRGGFSLRPLDAALG